MCYRYAYKQSTNKMIAICIFGIAFVSFLSLCAGAIYGFWKYCKCKKKSEKNVLNRSLIDYLYVS